MLSTQAVINTLRVLDELMSESELFTAHDVTKRVRDLVGPDQNVPHNGIRDLVHELYSSGRFDNDDLDIPYTRTFTNVTDTEQAFVYHPNDEDASEYRKSKATSVASLNSAFPASNTPFWSPVQAYLNDLTQGNNAVTATITKSTPTSTLPQSSANGEQHLVANKSGRLCIPVSIARTIGVGADDSVVVFTSGTPGTLNVKRLGYTWAPNSQNGNKLFTADEYGNIRIAVATLEALGVSGPVFKVTPSNGTFFTIETSDRKVVVDADTLALPLPG